MRSLLTLQRNYCLDVPCARELSDAAQSPAASLGTGLGSGRGLFLSAGSPFARGGCHRFAGRRFDHVGCHSLAVAQCTEARAQVQAGLDAPYRFHPEPGGSLLCRSEEWWLQSPWRVSLTR